MYIFNEINLLPEIKEENLFIDLEKINFMYDNTQNIIKNDDQLQRIIDLEEKNLLDQYGPFDISLDNIN